MSGLQAHLARAEHATVLAVVPALLLGGRAVSYVLFVWLLLRVAGAAAGKERYISAARPAKMWGWMAAYFALQLLGTLWSENVAAAQFSWEVKASFLVVPLIVMLRGALSAEKLRRALLQGVVYGTVAYLVLRLVNGIWLALNAAGPNPFAGLHYAGLAGDVHPTYLALYAAAGLAFLAELFPKRRRLQAGLAFFLLLSIGLLGSKAGVIAAVPALFFYARAQPGTSPRRLLTGLVGAALLATAAYVSSADRFLELATAVEAVEAIELQDAAAIRSSSSGRVAVWRSALELLTSHPMGVGTGDVEAELNALYARDHIDYALDRRLNPHNQWLQAGVAFGWPGVLIWSALLMSGWRLARRKNDGSLLAFMLILGLHASFESVLEAQRGVVFVAMVLAILALEKTTTGD